MITTTEPRPKPNPPPPELCPDCGGDLITVGARRACHQLYHDGGCGGFWTLRGGRWAKAALVLIALALAGCGKSHVGAESTGQVKTVTRETPLFCPDQWLADVSLGVMRNGTGSMSTHDEIFRAEDPTVLASLKTAAGSGALVTVTYDEDRFRWCIATQIITSVRPAALP